VSSLRFISNETEWVSDFGYHLIGGVELGQLSLELQIQGAFDSNVDTEFAAYIGFVW
jgi:hypothetical protein